MITSQSIQWIQSIIPPKSNLNHVGKMGPSLLVDLPGSITKMTRHDFMPVLVICECQIPGGHWVLIVDCRIPGNDTHNYRN